MSTDKIITAPIQLPAAIAPLPVLNGQRVNNSGPSMNPRTQRPQGENVYTVSGQWASRPDSERFTSMTALQAAKAAVKARSRQGVVANKGLRVEPNTADHKGLFIRNLETGGLITPTHHAFGQLAGLAKAPAGYLRTLPSEVTADCLNFGLHVMREVEEVKLLTREDENGVPYELAAINGPNYGRIWDADYAQYLIDHYGDGVTGKFTVPGVFGKPLDSITKRNTTLYASDSDMYVFLADETNRIEIQDRRDGKPGTMARGVICWNSEVGGNTIGAAFFLYDYVCGNRIIWGVQDFTEIKFRHTSGAPARWKDAIAPVLARFAAAPLAPVEARIQAAQKQKVDNLAEFLATRFTKSESKGVVDAFRADEGREPSTLFDVVTGVTALARDQDDDKRLELEKLAGSLLHMNERELVAV